MSGLENQQWYIEEIPATDPQEEIVTAGVAAHHPSVPVETELDNTGEPFVVLRRGATALDIDQSKVGARKGHTIAVVPVCRWPRLRSTRCTATYRYLHRFVIRIFRRTRSKDPCTCTPKPGARYHPGIYA